MLIPNNIIANADDLGLDNSVNRAILFCFEQGYINSTSLLTNTDIFDDTVRLIHSNPVIKNIGIHVNLAEGKPFTSFPFSSYLDAQGNWDLKKVSRKFSFLSPKAEAAFAAEIHAQIERAITAGVKISHLDSHYHLHTLPSFYRVFLAAARHFNLKIRLAQTYNQGNYLKFRYRKYINDLFKAENRNYSDHFGMVDKFIKTGKSIFKDDVIEIMLHPDFDQSGTLIDHYDKDALTEWIAYLKK